MIEIGEFLLEEKDDDSIWISIVNDGEGAEFDIKKLEEVIKQFYNDNF